jgi:hypothetical protein
MAENSVKKRARSSEARLPVLGIFRHFLASEMQPVAFLFGSFLFRPCEREMNKSNAGGHHLLSPL